MAKTYYVATTGSDNNAGTTVAPFATIQKAANVVVAGDTVIVKDGTYTTTSTIGTNITKTGTSSSLITFKAEHNGMAVLTGNNIGSYCFVLGAGVSYINFIGFEIKNFIWFAINLNNTSNPNTHITLTDNIIHDIGRVCDDSNQGHCGVYMHKATYVTFERNFFHDIGRYEPGESGCTMTTENYKNHDQAIYIDGGDSISIRYNVFYNCNRGWAIQVYSGSSYTLTNLNVYNNTFAYGNTYRDGGHITIAGTLTTANIKNNIFYGQIRAGIAVDVAYYTYTNVVIANNIAYYEDGDIVTATKTGITLTNNLADTDPKMVSPGTHDFTLQSNSPAINAGLNVGLTTDVVGNGIVGLPDLGAYEYQSVFYNTIQTGTATKNNCGAGYTGSTVTYTVPAHTYSSITSQVDADNQAIADVAANKQTYANTNGTCTLIPVYYNVATSGIATRNNCAEGQTASSVTYTVLAGTYSSIISQSDANAQAAADVNANKQAYANTYGTCTTPPPVTYHNVVASATATRNNCSAGYRGSTVTYTVAASTYSSLVSQADADAQAQADLLANKQTYANTNGTCTLIPVYYNTQVSTSVNRNNCGDGYIGSLVTYTIPANTYSSTISQSDAQSKATTDLSANAQSYANSNGTCTATPVYWNAQASGIATRNNCGIGYTGSQVTYVVAANTYSSTVSQAAADALASTDVNNNKQAYANLNGVCTEIPPVIYYNSQVSATATKDDCGSGYVGSVVTYTVLDNVYTSAISQSDADAQAQADLTTNKQAYANANGTCTVAPSTKYYSKQVYAVVTRNNCSSGYKGSSVTYIVPAKKYSSYISQADAQAKATADLAANKQTYANAHGRCTLIRRT
jgi:hypothetical protein